ncbi:AAC(3) family N-acetyltransferase [Crocinitomix algicola]|uniref:AAC(3) family N-acetyltransferase n=1 Tax=Crocinitomix algicola TaxID=1740263 RepID=UPI0008722467|nr:AAC(3) family N-acetyltransferase [Crocinitomix algicola]
MKLKDYIRKATPSFLLDWNRRRKKERRNAQLNIARKSGNSLSKDDLIIDLKEMGLKQGDSVLVHSSLSRIGHLKDGPKTFVDALLQVIGEEGTLLMPTSPNNVYQLNYIQNTPYFDVLNSPSRTGAITEYFRTLPKAVRSLHPTEPVSALGPLAEYYTKDHFNQLTPYNEKSPFYRISEQNGKILYVGVTLAMAGTNLHTLEDAVNDFKFPIYYAKVFDFDVIDKDGVKHRVQTKVHNPEFSKKRKCDDLIPLFEEKGVLHKKKLGAANTLVVQAKPFLDVMLKEYQEKGVTMYTPKGS